MRKILSIVAIGLFIVGLSSCGSTKDKCPSVGKVVAENTEIVA